MEKNLRRKEQVWAAEVVIRQRMRHPQGAVLLWQSKPDRTVWKEALRDRSEHPLLLQAYNLLRHTNIGVFWGSRRGGGGGERGGGRDVGATPGARTAGVERIGLHPLFYFAAIHIQRKIGAVESDVDRVLAPVLEHEPRSAVRRRGVLIIARARRCHRAGASGAVAIRKSKLKEGEPLENTVIRLESTPQRELERSRRASSRLVV